jgi:hypothetical protein
VHGEQSRAAGQYQPFRKVEAEAAAATTAADLWMPTPPANLQGKQRHMLMLADTHFK